LATVIIPAHNEGRVIGRLLNDLSSDCQPGEFDIVVVSNGSTDNTAVVAGQAGARVIEIDQASKYRALTTADERVEGCPRLYVDADIRLSSASARALLAALAEPGVLAVAPRRRLVTDDSTWPVRAYLSIWEQLPAVQTSLTGRGVLGVSCEGFARIAGWSEVLGDDLYFHRRFSNSERRIVSEAESVVVAPLTLRDLLRRRVRVVRGNAELNQRAEPGVSTSTASARGVLRASATHPARWPSIAVFLAVTATARLIARRRGADTSAWLRDESSRQAADPATPE
jgi:glycosyltransferase involved in cell wall biosynthesis